VLGAVYYFGIHPHILNALKWLSENLAFSFGIGMFYGVFIIDLVHSAQLVSKMKAFADEHDIIVRYEHLKLHIRKAHEKTAQKPRFLFAFRSEQSLAEHLSQARDAWEERKEKRHN
jgi:hypothetical protein